jgi:1-acyl-sn-glycerol-3-phosphate acyltransferase
MTWYSFFQNVLGAFLAVICRMEVVGKENLPSSGPFIVVANHQSVLDPIMVQVACRRPLHTLTKSTQFASGFFRWILPRINAIPTRRYRIDPQAVRMVLRRLSEGKGVGIYPEGERSWDAHIQPFRRGTVRLLLKAGVPVVPCGVRGSYDVWPRWSRSIRRQEVSVTFGEPIRWPAMDTRRERDASLVEASRLLRDRLTALSSWPGENGPVEAPSWLAGDEAEDVEVDVEGSERGAR